MLPTIRAIADHGVLIAFSDKISEEAHAMVTALDREIAADPPIGLIETVPAMVNLLVSFDPRLTDHAAVEIAVRSKMNGLKPLAVTGAERRIQVCYDDEFAPDLPDVAMATGLSAEAVINAHLAGDYKVLMYGFSPGYAYLGGVREEIQVPRKPKPVRDVPAGSVIIAGPQSLVTTLKMPTGWSVIGRSVTPILTSDEDHPFLLNVGDTVRFDRIDGATLERISRGPLHV